MKKLVGRLAILVITLVVLSPCAWIAASNGIFGDVEFGYYGEFNIAKHAIQKSGCAEAVEYSGVNKDLFLEEFHFKVTTKAGRIVLLWFDASNMDVKRLCYAPVGLGVDDPSHEEVQMYTIAGLAELLRGKNFEIRSLSDILCNLDELEEFFKTNHGDANDRLKADPYCWDYLRIEFPTAERLNDYHYTNIKDKDVVNWP